MTLSLKHGLRGMLATACASAAPERGSDDDTEAGIAANDLERPASSNNDSRMGYMCKGGRPVGVVLNANH